MYGFHKTVGRLVELWLASPITEPEVDRMLVEIRDVLRAEVRPIVVITDVVLSTVVAPEIADKLTSMMRSDNARVERNAMLLPSTSPIVYLQLERMIKEARSVSRRTFKGRAELEAWVSEVLDPKEKVRAAAFLDEREAAHRKTESG